MKIELFKSTIILICVFIIGFLVGKDCNKNGRYTFNEGFVFDTQTGTIYAAILSSNGKKYTKWDIVNGIKSTYSSPKKK